MARIISQINPETGRRQKVASVEGKTFQDRTQNLAESLGTTQKKASRLSNTQILKKIQPSSIPLTTLSSTETPAVAPKAPVSAPAPIDSMLTALPETLKAQRQQTQKAEESSFEALMAEALGQETPSAIRARIEEEKGIQELDLQATELANQITAEQEALRKKIEQVETAPGTATSAERDREIAELTRVSRRQQADLAITQLVAQGRLDSARRFADTLVQAEVEEGTKRINLLQMAYERNKELFTKAEQREFETMQADRERELQIAAQKDMMRFEAMINQTGISVPSPFMQTTVPSFEEYLSQREAELSMNVDPQSALYKQIQQDYEKQFAGQQEQGEFINKLLATKGGKSLTDTTIQKLDKGLTVLGQLGVLQENIATQNTGPLVGAFRSANPWDNNAQIIKQQLNAIVPNLARGVYGEVGVLTDNDIRTYARTIPNLSSTEEVRNAILYITLDMIVKSVKNTLSVNAAAGRDVSGFVDIYSNLEQTKSGILQSIGTAGQTLPGEDIYSQIIGEGLDYNTEVENGIGTMLNDLFIGY